MSTDIRTELEEYETLIAKIQIYENEMQRNLEEFVNTLQEARRNDLEGGEMAAKLDIFLLHVEMSSLKPSIYAETLRSNIRNYVWLMDSANNSVY